MSLEILSYLFVILAWIFALHHRKKWRAAKLVLKQTMHMLDSELTPYRELLRNGQEVHPDNVEHLSQLLREARYMAQVLVKLGIVKPQFEKLFFRDFESFERSPYVKD